MFRRQDPHHSILRYLQEGSHAGLPFPKEQLNPEQRHEHSWESLHFHLSQLRWPLPF